MNGAAVKTGERAQLLLACVQRRDRLRRVSGQNPPRFGQRAAPSVAFDELLACRALERSQVGTCGGLADAEFSRCR